MAGAVKPLVYISGPYSTGNPEHNVEKALVVADILHRDGFLPVVPHLTHFWHKASPKPYEAWMELDLALVVRCDAVFRMPGVSPGADREVAAAREAGLPVFTDIFEIRRAYDLSKV